MGAADDILGAFRTLLASRPFDDVTIAEVCKRAGVSNKTLYAHYDGKPGLVCALINEDFIEPVRQIRRVLDVDNIRSSTTLLLERSFQIFRDNEDVYANVIKGYGAEAFRADYVRLNEELDREIYEQYGLSGRELDFAAWFFASATASTLLWWSTEAPELSPQQVARLANTWLYAHWREDAASRQSPLVKPNRGDSDESPLESQA